MKPRTKLFAALAVAAAIAGFLPLAFGGGEPASAQQIAWPSGPWYVSSGDVRLRSTTAQVLVEAGTLAEPGLAGRLDTDTGVRLPTGDELQLVIGGAEGALVTGTQFRISGNARLYLNTGGTDALPAIANLTFTDTGFRWPADNIVTIVTNGTERLRVTDSQVTVAASGSETAPATVAAGGDADTGLFSPTQNLLGVTAGGVGFHVQTGSVQTTDATPTAVITIALADETAYDLDTVCVVRDQAATSAQRGMYHRFSGWHRDAAAAPAQQGATQTLGTDLETTAGMNVTHVASGNNVQVLGTGIAATTMRWRCRAFITYASTT